MKMLQYFKKHISTRERTRVSLHVYREVLVGAAEKEEAIGFGDHGGLG